MSDGTITRRDVRFVEEGRDVAQRIGQEAKAFGDRMPHGEALRSAAREVEAAAQELDAKLDGLRKKIPDGDVRL